MSISMVSHSESSVASASLTCNLMPTSRNSATVVLPKDRSRFSMSRASTSSNGTFAMVYRSKRFGMAELRNVWKKLAMMKVGAGILSGRDVVKLLLTRRLEPGQYALMWKQATVADKARKSGSSCALASAIGTVVAEGRSTCNSIDVCQTAISCLRLHPLRLVYVQSTNKIMRQGCLCKRRGARSDETRQMDARPVVVREIAEEARRPRVTERYSRGVEGGAAVRFVQSLICD